MKKSLEKARYIDIFAGCGGMSLGLCNAGWEGIFAIEKDKMAFETLKHNLMHHFDWPTWLPVKEIDIENFIAAYQKQILSLKGKVDLVVGGPPCQGFSMAGKRKRGDERNKMVDSYIKFIDLVRPRFLFFENVYGFTTAFRKKSKTGIDVYSEHIVNELGSLGYNVAYDIVDFSKFGVPQKRKRFILIGAREASIKTFFSDLNIYKEEFLKKRGLSTNVSAEDAISDLEKRHGQVKSKKMTNFNMGIYSLPKSNYQRLLRKKIKEFNSLPDSHRFTNHSKKVVMKFKYILENSKRNKSIDETIKLKFNIKKHTLKALDRAQPSPTLTTLPDDYIHYLEPRILTVREYARLQSFDDSFQFKGKYTTGGTNRVKEVPRYTQIGNAIPPIFGEQVGAVFLKMRGSAS